jgi:nucleoside-diphosphate-sugar epimerase
MKRILVTGGFGFLGSHLIERLLTDSTDVRVHVVDNLSTSPLPLDFLLDELGRPTNLSYSITDLDNYCRSNSTAHFHEIYHLASVVGPAGILKHNGRIAASILNDTMAVVDLAMRTGARVVDVSTSEVYGGGQNGFCSESMPKIVPETASARLEYAVGKLAGETAVLNLCKAGSIDARIVRPFNVTGPRQSGRGGFVLPRFIAQAMEGRDLTIFGDGTQIRAFTDVRDMVAGFVLAMERAPSGQVFNLGNPENRCSILDLANDVLAAVGGPSRLTFVDPKHIYGNLYEEANNKFPDARKAMGELGWRPRFMRRDVVKDAYEYMKGVPSSILAELRGY